MRERERERERERNTKQQQNITEDFFSFLKDTCCCCMSYNSMSVLPEMHTPNNVFYLRQFLSFIFDVITINYLFYQCKFLIRLSYISLIIHINLVIIILNEYLKYYHHVFFSFSSHMLCLLLFQCFACFSLFSSFFPYLTRLLSIPFLFLSRFLFFSTEFKRDIFQPLLHC